MPELDAIDPDATESYWYEKLAPLMAEVRKAEAHARKHGAGMIPSSAKGMSAAMNRARQELWDLEVRR